MQQWLDGPHPRTIELVKRDRREWCRQLVVSDSKLHGSSEVGAAEHSVTIHAVSRQVDARTDCVRQVWISRERHRVSITLNKLISGNPRRGRMQIIKVHSSAA